MSASVKGESFRPLPVTSPFEDFPPLPMIDHELNQYFQISRQLEAALIQQRTQIRNSQEEIRQLRQKQNEVTKISEEKLREASNREKDVQEQIKVFTQQIDQLRASQIALKDATGVYQEREEAFRKCVHSYQEREKARLSQLAQITQQFEDAKSSFQNQKQTWTHLDEGEKRVKNQLVLDLEILQGKYQQSLQNEESHREAQQRIQAQLEASLQHAEVLNRDLILAKQTLSQTGEVNQRAKRVFLEDQELKKEVEKLRLELNEKRTECQALKTDLQQANQGDNTLKEKLEGNENLNRHLEERLKKESRDKQIALNCLHNAEIRLTRVSTELDELKQRSTRKFDDPNCITVEI